MRREWIDEEKPRTQTPEFQDVRRDADAPHVNQGEQRPTGDLMNLEDPPAPSTGNAPPNVVEGDLQGVELSLASADRPLQLNEGTRVDRDRDSQPSGREENARRTPTDLIPEDDELEALLNEQPTEGDGSNRRAPRIQEQQENGFLDELEAMEEFGVLGSEIT